MCIFQVFWAKSIKKPSIVDKSIKVKTKKFIKKRIHKGANRKIYAITFSNEFWNNENFELRLIK